MDIRTLRPETQAVRAGTNLDKKSGSLATPIYQTSTFEVRDNDEQLQVTDTDHFYTRCGNPTNSVVERAIAELEGTEAALLFSSGMNAVTTTLLSLLEPGDHIVAQRDIYGGTTKFLTGWLPKFGIEATFVDTTDYGQYERAVRPNTKLLYLENPTNPLLRVIDLCRTAEIAREHRLISLIDSTFATPINQRPADYGIDLVLHSGTKYFAGHSDLICGMIAGRRELLDPVHQARNTLGGNMDPHAAWLLLRGIKTLAIRVERQNENALRVAQFLSHHAGVRCVHYPFLESHPQHVTAVEQLKGGGGVLSFEVAGSGDDARRLTENLNLFTLAPSLGGVDSLVSIPVLTSHLMVAPEHREKMGITPQLIRLSVGIESADDLVADLDQAITALDRAGQHTRGLDVAQAG